MSTHNSMLSAERIRTIGVPAFTIGFVHAKQRLLVQNNKSLRVPDLPVGLCMQNSVVRTRITSLYGSQTSPVVLCMQSYVLTTWFNCFYGCQTTSIDLCKQNIVLSTKITILYGSQTSSVVFCIHNSDFYDQNYKSVWVPDLTWGFVPAKQHAYIQS